MPTHLPDKGAGLVKLAIIGAVLVSFRSHHLVQFLFDFTRDPLDGGAAILKANDSERESGNFRAEIVLSQEHQTSTWIIRIAGKPPDDARGGRESHAAADPLQRVATAAFIEMSDSEYGHTPALCKFGKRIQDVGANLCVFVGVDAAHKGAHRVNDYQFAIRVPIESAFQVREIAGKIEGSPIDFARLVRFADASRQNDVAALGLKRDQSRHDGIGDAVLSRKDDAIRDNPVGAAIRPGPTIRE